MIRSMIRNMVKKKVGSNKINKHWEIFQNKLKGDTKELRIYKNNGRKAYLRYVG